MDSQSLIVFFHPFPFNKFLTTSLPNNSYNFRGFIQQFRYFPSVTRKAGWHKHLLVGTTPHTHSSHNQDYSSFSRESQPKPSFVTVTGWCRPNLSGPMLARFSTRSDWCCLSSQHKCPVSWRFSVKISFVGR